MSEQTSIKQTFRVSNMTCVACERHIDEALIKLDGVSSVRSRFGSGLVTVVYNPQVITESSIVSVLKEEQYPVVGPVTASYFIKQWAAALGVVVLIAVGYLWLSNQGVFNAFPMVTDQMALPMLFVIGLLTSVHCIAMCGGINISQCSNVAGTLGAAPTVKQKLMPSFLYNAGRVTSYTVIGGIVGAIGSSITPSGSFRGTVTIIAAAFMMIMGASMLNVLPGLSRLVPHLPRGLARFIGTQRTGKGPYVIGLLNGLMPCGPLQAMQLYALSTGSVVMGALSMFMFSVGTVPLMFALGALSSFLNAKFSASMTKVSAVLVVLLGIIMLNNGLALSGINPLF